MTGYRHAKTSQQPSSASGNIFAIGGNFSEDPVVLKDNWRKAEEIDPDLTNTSWEALYQPSRDVLYYVNF